MDRAYVTLGVVPRVFVFSIVYLPMSRVLGTIRT